MKTKRNFFMFVLVLMLLLTMISCQRVAPTTPELTDPDVIPKSAPQKEQASELTLDVLGTTRSVWLDSDGKLSSDYVIASADGAVLLAIEENTKLLDKNGMPLPSILISQREASPQAEGVIVLGAAYSVLPKDASFDQPITLSLGYDPQRCPNGVDNDDIFVSFYDEQIGWSESQYARINRDSHMVTTQILRFGTYAVITALEELSPVPTAQVPSDIRVEVVYFHRPQRCTKCLCFEKRVSLVMADEFQTELNSGQVTFQIMNIADENNEALIQQYGPIGSQLFVNTIIDGVEHIRDVKEIWSWDCTSDTNHFHEEVKNVIDHSLQGQP